MNFFTELKRRYTEKDFAENLGVLLRAYNTTPEEDMRADKFAYDVCTLADVCLMTKKG